MSERIERAKLVLATYAMERGFAGDVGEDITDLMADLLHLAAELETGDSPFTIHRLAWVHYMAEDTE